MIRLRSVPRSLSPTEPLSLLRLLAIFFKIGSVGFGGGMAVIALMEREFVQQRKLLTPREFLHGVGLGQILGSFAVNASFFIGYRLFGALGGILSATAFLTPSLVLVTVLSHFYFRYHSIPALQGVVAGLGPVVIALILAAAWSLGQNFLKSPVMIGIAGAALVAGVMKVNAAWVILAAGIVGLLLPGTRRSLPQAPREPFRSTLAAVALPATLGPLSLLGSLTMTFLKMGVVFFGGGFVLVPLLHRRLVTDLAWLSPREFLDGVAISNLTPGPIAVLATFAGYRVAGVPGALVATAALLAPALGLMLVIMQQYERYHGDDRAQRFLNGVNPAAAGLILSAAVSLQASAIGSWRGWLLCGIALLLLRVFRWHPAFALAIGSAAGYAGLLP